MNLTYVRVVFFSSFQTISSKFKQQSPVLDPLRSASARPDNTASANRHLEVVGIFYLGPQAQRRVCRNRLPLLLTSSVSMIQGALSVKLFPHDLFDWRGVEPALETAQGIILNKL